jgi:hypothetical protein
MYSLALIIFVVSEKKAFEHFPKRFFSETTWTIEIKLPRNDHCKVLYKVWVFYADRKSNMATTAGNRLTLNPLENVQMPSSCGGSHLGFPIGIKNLNFIVDLPMIILGKFGLNCLSGFREETTNMIKAKLNMNVHWMVLYKL